MIAVVVQPGVEFGDEQVYFIEPLEQVMTEKPNNWQKHYHGSFKEPCLARKYSCSDRARYYIGEPKVAAAQEKLLDNLTKYPIPMNMLHQYMPIQYEKVRSGALTPDPKQLAMDGAAQFMAYY